MKNYAEMTDTEINAEVAERLGVDFEAHESGIYASVKWCGDNVVSVAGIVDYCNNWADAGPVIVDNRISIHMEEMEEIAYHGVYYDEISGSVDRYEFSADAEVNPLRAAMIVFLMMKDAEK